jgi:hypothetical protein
LKMNRLVVVDAGAAEANHPCRSLLGDTQ